jgi:hypothetical protein
MGETRTRLTTLYRHPGNDVSVSTGIVLVKSKDTNQLIN